MSARGGGRLWAARRGWGGFVCLFQDANNYFVQLWARDSDSRRTIGNGETRNHGSNNNNVKDPLLSEHSRVAARTKHLNQLEWSCWEMGLWHQQEDFMATE